MWSRVLLKELSDGRGLLAKVVFVARGDHDRQCRADWNPAGHKRRAPSRTTGLPIPVGKKRTFLGHAVDVGCGMAQRQTPARISTEVAPAGVVGHEHDNVRSLRIGLLCLPDNSACSNEAEDGQNTNGCFANARSKVHRACSPILSAFAYRRNSAHGRNPKGENAVQLVRVGIDSGRRQCQSRTRPVRPTDTGA